MTAYTKGIALSLRPNNRIFKLFSAPAHNKRNSGNSHGLWRVSKESEPIQPLKSNARSSLSHPQLSHQKNSRVKNSRHALFWTSNDIQ